MKELRGGSLALETSLPFKLIYEDRDIVVVDKPPGILSVPIPGARVPSLQGLLKENLKGRWGNIFPVHRLDRYTSGVMMFAKNRASRSHLVKQFRKHSPLRLYLAVVRGRPRERSGELRHWLRLTKWGFRQLPAKPKEDGAALAVMRYRLVEAFVSGSLLEVELVTGLKNQIRVQLALSGTPIWGDRHYAPGEKDAEIMDRQALHSWRLGFVHPRQERYVEFEAEPPEDFRRLLRYLRRPESRVAP